MVTGLTRGKRSPGVGPACGERVHRRSTGVSGGVRASALSTGYDSYITLSALHDYARFRKMRLRFEIIIQAGPIRFDNERVPSRMILGTKVPATIETFHFEVSVPSDASDGDGAARTAAINRRRDQNVLPAIGYEILTLPLLDRLRPSHCTGDK